MLIPIISSAQNQDPVYSSSKPKSLKGTAYKIILPTKGNAILYQEVIIDSASQIELHKRAKEWFITTFVNSKAVLENEDSSSLIGKGYFGNAQFDFLHKTYDVSFKIEVDFKPDKYRVLISDFECVCGEGDATMDRIYAAYLADYPFFINAIFEGKKQTLKDQREIITDFNSRMDLLISSIERGMQDTSNDW